MAATQKRGDAARSRLIATTAELLHTQGYGKTGLQQIVAESGTPKGSLYFHFPGGKDELVTAALHQSGGQLSAALAALLQAAPDPTRAIAAVVDWFRVQLEASGYQKGCPVATVALEVAGTSDSIHQVCSSIYSEWRRLIADRLTAHGISPERAAPLSTLILNAVEGALLLCRAHRSAEPLIETGAELARLVEREVAPHRGDVP